MQIGDLVRVHWGNCDWSGVEGRDWGYAPGVIVGEIEWWKPETEGIFPCGNVHVFVQGATTAYNIGRLEAVNESR